MKILVIQHKAGDRFRTVQYYKALEERGFEIDDPHWDIKEQWNRYLKRAKEVNVIWIARRMISYLKLHQLKKANPNIIFDYDDALFLRSSRHGAGTTLSKKVKFNQMIKAAKSVVAGNDFLADVAKKHVKAENVYIVPSTVNRDWYVEREDREVKELNVGWLGSESTLPYLERMKSIFTKFNHLGLPWKLTVVSDKFPNWRQLPVENVLWSLEDEKKAMGEIDLGVNPLIDDDWCRGKCAIKAVQYMAGGAAVAGPAVGVNKLLIKEGERGWFANTEDEWLKVLEEAATNLPKVKAYGQTSREWILNNYSMESQLDHLVDIFEKTAQ